MSRAYAVSDGIKKTPSLNPRKPGKWIVLRLAMGILGEVPEGKPLPKKMIREIPVPLFTMIATDRDAAMKEISRNVGELFIAWENEKALCEAGVKRKRS